MNVTGPEVCPTCRRLICPEWRTNRRCWVAELMSLLDARVEELCAKILLTFPDCTTKTLEELRKPKLEAWNRNKEDSRAWLALNMMTEARAGFTAFNEGSKDDREVDFVLLRQKLAAGQSWVGPLHDSIQPKLKRGA